MIPWIQDVLNDINSRSGLVETLRQAQGERFIVHKAGSIASADPSIFEIYSEFERQTFHHLHIVLAIAINVQQRVVRIFSDRANINVTPFR